MASIEVHAGDFRKGAGAVTSETFILLTDEHPWVGEKIPLYDLEMVDVASEESVKKLGGTLGWGAAGGLLLGPVGLLAGLLVGGRKKQVTFVARFRDGRKLLATTDSSTFTTLQAELFDR